MSFNIKEAPVGLGHSAAQVRAYASPLSIQSPSLPSSQTAEVAYEKVWVYTTPGVRASADPSHLFARVSVLIPAGSPLPPGHFRNEHPAQDLEEESIALDLEELTFLGEEKIVPKTLPSPILPHRVITIPFVRPPPPLLAPIAPAPRMTQIIHRCILPIFNQDGSVKFDCEDCKESFTDEFKLRFHYAYVHRTPVPLRPYAAVMKCSVVGCELIFKSSIDLKNHEACHGIRRSVKRVSDSDPHSSKKI